MRWGGGRRREVRGERSEVRGQRLEVPDFLLSSFHLFRSACIDSAPSVLFVADRRREVRGERLWVIGPAPSFPIFYFPAFIFSLRCLGPILYPS